MGEKLYIVVELTPSPQASTPRCWGWGGIARSWVDQFGHGAELRIFKVIVESGEVIEVDVTAKRT